MCHIMILKGISDSKSLDYRDENITLSSQEVAAKFCLEGIYHWTSVLSKASEFKFKYVRQVSLQNPTLVVYCCCCYYVLYSLVKQQKYSLKFGQLRKSFAKFYTGITKISQHFSPGCQDFQCYIEVQKYSLIFLNAVSKNKTLFICILYL